MPRQRSGKESKHPQALAHETPASGKWMGPSKGNGEHPSVKQVWHRKGAVPWQQAHTAAQCAQTKLYASVCIASVERGVSKIRVLLPCEIQAHWTHLPVPPASLKDESCSTSSRAKPSHPINKYPNSIPKHPLEKAYDAECSAGACRRSPCGMG